MASFVWIKGAVIVVKGVCLYGVRGDDIWN